MDNRNRHPVLKRVGLVFLVLVLITGAFLGGWFGRYATIDPRMRSLLWALDVTNDHYIGEFDEDELYRNYYNALSPDIYSGFFTAAEYRQELKEMEGQSSGVGIALNSLAKENELQISSVVGNSPSYRAGIRAGMYIYAYGAAGGELTEATTQSAFMEDFPEIAGGRELLVGYDRETAVSVVVEPKSYIASYCSYSDSEKSYAFLSESGTPVLTEVTDIAGTLEGADGKTAYLRLDEFTGDAAAEFRSLLAMMQSRGRENLVLDLRSNGGGALDVLIPIASHLCKNATAAQPLILTVRYKDGSTTRCAASAGDYYKYFTEQSRIVVLANEYTASASECLLGTMLDYGTIGYEDLIVREETGRTYGKGVMQTYFVNNGAEGDGSAMKLTVATVHWPVSGTCINGKGIGVADGATAVDEELVAGKEDKALAAALARLSAAL